MGLQKAWSMPHSGRYYTNAGELGFKGIISTVHFKIILIYVFDLKQETVI